ncbi:MAG: hypothetical protein Kow0099_04960 [Candidatus Abyssubacteria bacterium]
MLDTLIEAFNCEHEGVAVTGVMMGPSSGTVAERLLLDSVAPGVPALALVEREAIPMLADAGVILPLDEYLGASQELKVANLFDSAKDYCTYDGKLYGVPAYLNPHVLIYDPRILSEAGIEKLPESWNELFKLAQGRERAEGEPWVLSLRSAAIVFEILCVQQDVDLLADEPEVMRLKLREILQRIRGLRDAGLLPPHHKFWAPEFRDVAGGEVLFQIDNAAMLSYLREKAAASLDVALPPSDSRPASFLAGSQVFVLPASSDKKDEAIQFLEFFFASERYSRLAEELLFVSPYAHTRPQLTVSAPEGDSYFRLLLAAKNAGVFPLRSDSAKVLPAVSRTVEKLDAGLVTVEQALEEILRTVSAGGGQERGLRAPVVRVSWAESTRRLFCEEASDFRAPPIEIVSARNEHECIQLAISASRELDGLRVSVEPFVAEDGSRRDIEATVYEQTDTSISIPLAADKAGNYPNILKRASGFTVSPGRLARFWLDVHVSEGEAEGELSSRVVVRRRGRVLCEVPLRLRVAPLTLPVKPSRPAVVGLNYDLIAGHYGLERGTKSYRDMMDAYYWFMVRHRLSPYQPPVPIESEEAAGYLRDIRVSGCRVPFPPGDARFAEVVRLAKDGGWHDKLYVYFIDEPTYHQYRAVIETGTKIDAVEPSPRFLVSCFPDRPLIGVVDIWCVLMRFLPEGIPHGFVERPMYFQRVSERLRAGDEVWWYTAGAITPFPTLHIEDEPATFRAIPWLQELCGIRGFLHWEAAFWVQPFEEPFIQYFGNGEGALVYPGDSGPNSSVRLELLREGIEDQELLLLLGGAISLTQEELGAEWLGDAATRRIGEVCRRILEEDALRSGIGYPMLLSHFTREPGRIEELRREVLEETISMRETPLAVVLTEPPETRYTDSEHARIYGAVEPGTRVEVNGRALEVGPDNSFSGRFSLSSGANLFVIRLEKGRHSKLVVRKILRL